jgi:NAD(P)-dependent dehydrogenase (short-subunit alcohol dehydrogenase family)
VVASRDEPGLAGLVDEITAHGGDAVSVVCDVTDYAQVARVAEEAVRAFGRIDSWVNNAAVSVYARFEDTSPEEFRRVFDVNVMGQVHGAKAALPHLRREGRGALIAISSVESVVSMPLHIAYSASKHAVEGFIDGLRRELQGEGVPVSVTSVKPATINTPLFDNSLSRLGVKPRGAPPVYEPEVVAECVLYAAEHPVRDLWAGGAGRALALTQWTAPRLVDAALSRLGPRVQRTEEPEPAGATGNLYSPRADRRTRGDFTDEARGFSLYTWLETHPWAALLAAGGVAGGAALLGRAQMRR